MNLDLALFPLDVVADAVLQETKVDLLLGVLGL